MTIPGHLFYYEDIITALTEVESDSKYLWCWTDHQFFQHILSLFCGMQIETRNNKLEMQSVNNKALIEELDKVIERLRVPSEVR